MITVVSGLPRSGTSLMMQMLHAGGFPCLADELRQPDDDNPRGYFEFDKVKRLRTDNSWLPLACGKAGKIISQLLPFLPAELAYRVIFMKRNLDEVLASQHKMLARLGRGGGDVSDQRLGELFARQLQQVKAQLADRNIPTLYIGHREALEHPIKVAARVNAFLGGVLDEGAMTSVVDPNLYRQREK